MRKILVFFIYFLSFTMPQNEGLVKTYYPNNLDPKKLGAIETEGNYQMVFETTMGFGDGEAT